MFQVAVYKIPMDSPDDVSGLRTLIEAGEVKADEIVGMIGKTEGSGGADDFTRGFAVTTLRHLLAEKTGRKVEEIAGTIPMTFSGGADGVISPHVTVFTRREVPPEGRGNGGEKRLSVGRTITRVISPVEIGTLSEVKEVARGVREAMAFAQIEDPEDVHYVQCKGPLLTTSIIAKVEEEGGKCVTNDPFFSIGYSNGAMSLGTALALGEVKEEDLSDDVIGKRWDLYTLRGSSSAGNEFTRVNILLIGNSPHSVSAYVSGHGVMKDIIDTGGVKEALRNAGLKFACCPTAEDQSRVVAAFAQISLEPFGRIRGRRTTILSTSDIRPIRPLKAVTSGTIASVIGDPMIYVSGAFGTMPTHAGGLPPESGPVAVIVKV